jgi:hypothetical protein
VNIYHMRNLENTEDAFVVAESVDMAHKLYVAQYGHDTEFMMKMTGGISKCLMEVKDESKDS